MNQLSKSIYQINQSTNNSIYQINQSINQLIKLIYHINESMNQSNQSNNLLNQIKDKKQSNLLGSKLLEKLTY